MILEGEVSSLTATKFTYADPTDDAYDPEQQSYSPTEGVEKGGLGEWDKDSNVGDDDERANLSDVDVDKAQLAKTQDPEADPYDAEDEYKAGGIGAEKDDFAGGAPVAGGFDEKGEHGRAVVCKTLTSAS